MCQVGAVWADWMETPKTSGLTVTEAEYRDKHHLKRLTFDGFNDLYQTRHGAVTIRHAIELDQRRLPVQAVVKPVIVSDELEMRNERCIDEFGCGTF